MWKKVFYHNFTGRVMFSSESEALHCETTQKFSILDTISPKYKYREKYEFIIWYPSLDYYFQWRQSMNPVLELEKSGKNESEGFELIHKGYDDKDDPFGGLVKTAGTMANNRLPFLNGVPSGYGSADVTYAVGIYADSWYTAGDQIRHRGVSTKYKKDMKILIKHYDYIYVIIIICERV